MNDLEDVLNGEETPEVEIETPETEVEVESIETTEEAKGDEEAVETPTTEQEESSQPAEQGLSVEDLQKQVQGLTHAVSAERQKRHKLEENLNNSPEARTQQENAFWQDPLGGVTAVVDRKLQENTVNVTDSVLEKVIPDYAEMRTFYIEKAQQNPALLKNAADNPNPALYIYETAKQMKQIEEFGDIDTWRANEKAKMEQEYEAKVQAGIKKALETQSELPGSVGDLRAAQSNSAKPFREKSLAELFGSN
ncbi:MAG: hypothetical protein KZQ94_15945 [Candidatus Thiodiazotropha sp. (ex Troendleina suluensis)]|nr:hypothetical protein [Candidatus Thiodiazotropha sp. (ex Troendleina suluensis)]